MVTNKGEGDFVQELSRDVSRNCGKEFRTDRAVVKAVDPVEIHGSPGAMR